MTSQASALVWTNLQPSVSRSRKGLYPHRSFRCCHAHDRPEPCRAAHRETPMSRISRPLVTALSTLALTAAGLTVTVGTAHAQSCSQDYLPLPDPGCQPGALN